MDITGARCKVILFSEPLTVQRETLTVVKNNPKGIAGHDSFVKNSALKLAAIAGSSQEAYAKTTMKVPSDQIVPVPDHRTGIDAVLSGRADAMALGEFSVKRVTNDDDRQKLETFPLAAVPVTGTAVAFRKGDKAFRDQFDQELAKLRSSGELGKLYREWGFTNPDDLLKVKRADLAEGCE
jgi:polar amino acid transport system substrate-binding protein